MNLPCAHGGPAGSARLRASPEDFVVREWLGFEADGEGDHLLLKVRKRGANTMWVAKQLAKIGKIHPRDIGFAGLKDRDAVAEQSFTVPARSAVGTSWAGVTGDGFEVLSADRQRRKLKRGALKGNDFVLVLREFAGDAADARAAFANIVGRRGTELFRATAFRSRRAQHHYRTGLVQRRRAGAGTSRARLCAVSGSGGDFQRGACGARDCRQLESAAGRRCRESERQRQHLSRRDHRRNIACIVVSNWMCIRPGRCGTAIRCSSTGAVAEFEANIARRHRPWPRVSPKRGWSRNVDRCACR